MAKIKPARKLKLPKRTPIREGLVVAFARVLRYANDMAQQADMYPETAVYEFRKSARRARAILKLLQPYIDREAYDELNGQLRLMGQSVSGLRDADVWLLTLQQLPQPESGEEQAQRDAIHLLILGQQQQLQRQETPAALDIDLTTLAQLPELLAAHVPEHLDWKHLNAGIIRTFKRARRDMYVSLNEDDETIHDWRKRIKALRYQLEMLSSLSKHEELVRARILLARLAQHLGQVTDKMVLRDFIVALDPKSHKRYKVLIKRIERIYLAEFAYCMALCQAFFDESPKKLVKQWTAPIVLITQPQCAPQQDSLLRPSAPDQACSTKVVMFGDEEQ